jgi:uncharacterized protein DUF3592
VGVFQLVRTIGFSGRAVATEGTVVELLESYDSESGTTFSPLVRYSDSTGQSHDFQSHVGNNPPRYKVGQVVQVKYDREHPERGHFASAIGVWGYPISMTLGGIAMMAAGIILRVLNIG